MKKFEEVMGNNLNNSSFVSHSISKSVDRVMFACEHYGIEEQIARQILNHVQSNVELHQYVSNVTGDMVLKLLLKTYVNTSSETIKVPKTCWDMFKHQHFPAWLLKRFPCKYTEIHTNKKLFFIDGKTVSDPYKAVLKYPERPSPRTSIG